MRICFFADAHNLHVQQLASDLATRGHEVAVVCHKPVTIPGVRVERFNVPEPGLRHPFRWTTRRDRYLRSFLRRYDVVVVFFLHEWSFTPEIIEAGCLVASPRGSDIVPPPGEGPPSTELVESRKTLLRHAALVGVAGPRFARIVADFANIDGSAIEALPLGVDLEQFLPPEPQRSARRPAPRVGFLKGFRPVYGAADLVRAIPHVLAQLPATRFDLVGDGPDLPHCRQIAGELGVERAIDWIPRIPHDNVPNLLARWDLMAMPSICESFGVAALEASAMCVPVVASDVGGLPDTVRDGETGVLVPPRSPKTLADAIVVLLGDNARRVQMGKAGREWVRQRFDRQQVVDQWETTLQVALDRVSVMV